VGDTGDLIPRAKQALDGLAVPARPRDGDCLVWEPRVTALLVNAGMDAAGVVVIGWVDRPGRLLAYAHRTTLLARRVVVDCTARQFEQELPGLWVAELPAYCSVLAAATGVAEVTVTPTAAARTSALPGRPAAG
jgi:hypothetical protein